MNDNMTALQCFKMAIYYDPNFYIAHYNIGNMYFIQKRYDKALISFNKVNISYIYIYIYTQNYLLQYINKTKRIIILICLYYFNL